ncbi:hypothetical protein SKAU_G00334490 [Synaphobranchus kaupii]|uniref:Uncharacterized protein n=1 Tax=Synaphobranchus kaupii TaxID=118154 RepID=A0A9Q1IGM6_SYNKA|nr:hypothetical protein SKAU_G00334490 [Synaphobranchus kaupii]
MPLLITAGSCLHLILQLVELKQKEAEQLAQGQALNPRVRGEQDRAHRLRRTENQKKGKKTTTTFFLFREPHCTPRPVNPSMGADLAQGCKEGMSTQRQSRTTSHDAAAASLVKAATARLSAASASFTELVAGARFTTSQFYLQVSDRERSIDLHVFATLNAREDGGRPTKRSPAYGGLIEDPGFTHKPQPAETFSRGAALVTRGAAAPDL